MRAFSCPFHVAPQVLRHPCSVDPRRLAFLAVVLFSAAAVGLAIPRLIRPDEPTVVRPIILKLEDRDSNVRTDHAEGGKQSAGGGTVNGAGTGSYGARPVQPPPPPPAGDDNGADDDGDD